MAALSSTTEVSIGETVARNIAREMTRVDWDYEELGEASGLGWANAVAFRADASSMNIFELVEIARALGVTVADLVKLA